MQPPRTIIAIAIAAALCGNARGDDGPDAAFFRGQVAPILERRCVQCHGPDDPKGNLRLDNSEKALAGGDSGPAFEPGKPDESLLVEYISGDEPQMPKNATPLSKEEIATIRKWIAAGAIWPKDLTLIDRRFEGQKWWSLEPLARPATPKTNSPWVRTPIDAFILEALQKNNLAPSAEADRRTLHRRLAFDLHGLPPSPEDVEAFARDPDPLAYEKLVDRLLDSPRYGERWARHWLDAVHYGDTHGYDKDKVRPHAWPYRDYVIRALNSGKPYRRFIEEQLAGDVLDADTADGIVATGFIAAGPWDFVGHVELREGTTDKEIARSLDRDDMVATAMSTFTSVTVHCARCHDHKFDPIPQRDYYTLQAVFAGVERANRPYDPDPKSANRRAQLTAKQDQLRAQRDAVAVKAAALEGPAVREIDRQIAELSRSLNADPKRFPELPRRTLGYHSLIEKSPDVTKWVQVDLGRDVPIDYVVLFPSHEAYAGYPGPGFGYPRRFRLDVSSDRNFTTPKLIADHTASDVPNPGDAPQLFAAPKGTTARYVRVTATRLWERTNDFALALSELAVLSEGKNAAAGAKVTALDTIEAGGAWGKAHLTDGAFARTSFKQASEAITKRNGAYADFFADLLTARSSIGDLTSLQRKRAELSAAAIPPDLRREIDQTARDLKTTEAELASLPKSQLVYAAASSFTPEGNFTPPPQNKPRPIHVLHRGSVAAPKDLVSPAALSCVTSLDARLSVADSAPEGQRRAALARWIADPKNPLTWRSIVNRVWQYHFGQGLVASPNDFGRMGATPTHGELLDWLAVEFRDGDQSLKTLHRLIVTSAVYRQVSTDDAEKAKLDAGNRWLWRMNRRRLESEAIRDSALAVTGKLDLAMYGPGFREFGFLDDHSPHYKYHEHDPDDPRSHRRSIYRFIVRSVPDPFMDTLDCADASAITARRNETVTALQALALLNNKFMLKMAEHFAARVSRERTDLPAQIDRAVDLAFGRSATESERAVLVDYANKHGLPNTCRLILNMNEFVFVD